MHERGADEVYRHHATALIARDIEDIVADYAEDAVFITSDGVLHGRDGVRQGFTKLLADLPDARFNVRTRIRQGDVLYLEWSATGTGVRADDGVETLLLRDGAIALQTIHYTLLRVTQA